MQLRSLQNMRHQGAGSGHQLEHPSGRRRPKVCVDLKYPMVKEEEQLYSTEYGFACMYIVLGWLAGVCLPALFGYLPTGSEASAERKNEHAG